jgi:secreted trypsin-like serine protease
MNHFAYRSNGIQLKVRLGEWDAANINEPLPFQEFNVARIFVHPQFSSSTLANSIAILRLASNVPLGQTPTITTACLTGKITLEKTLRRTFGSEKKFIKFVKS